ncbi:DivIVA domain-containing protein [Modestobacter sp. SYSU DS0875]
MSAAHVHDVVFREPPFGGGRGYDEGQVDDLLDRIEAALRG